MATRTPTTPPPAAQTGANSPAQCCAGVARRDGALILRSGNPTAYRSRRNEAAFRAWYFGPDEVAAA